MPKKFQGENSKSAAARARKAEVKAAADAKLRRELEDAFWKDDDKHIARKEQRKIEKEKKRVEVLERKKEIQRLLDEEGCSLATKASKSAPLPAKITRAQIEASVKKENGGQATEEVKEKQMSHLEVPLEENVNRIMPSEDDIDARTVEDAIAALSTGESVDHHPERRLRAAYAAFEDANLGRLKKENPNMRLSQLKQMLKKEWMKSPDNPLNQLHGAYNGVKN